MDNEDDIQRYASGSDGAPNRDCFVSIERLDKARRNIAGTIDSLACDQSNIEEMMINLQSNRPIWHDLYEDEQDWLEWGYPWVRKYLEKITP